jgi:hypothetical protein
MSFPVLISSANYQGGNLFKVSFPNIIDLNDFEASISELFIYYSWYNISAAANNNSFQITIPLATPVTATLTLPDGAYNISTINNYFQYWCIQNGYYLQNPTTLQYYYFGTFQVSPQSYQVQFITTALPSSSGGTDSTVTPQLGSYVGLSSYSTVIVGSGFHNLWPTTANQSMQLTISSTNTFGAIIGFVAGTFPTSPTISGTTNTVSSTLTPNVNPVSTVQCRLSCLYNQFSSNSQLLHVFTNQGVGIGSMINASPQFLQGVPCSGSHKDLYFSFYDVLGNPLQLLDSNICVKLDFIKIKK